MDTTFLREVWKEACRNQQKIIDEGMSGKHPGDIKMWDTPDFTLPYQDKAEQVIDFIQRHELDAVQRMTKPLTKEDAAWLLSRYPIDIIEETLMAMENFPRLNSKYKSAKLTANNWAKQRMGGRDDNGNNNVRAQYS